MSRPRSCTPPANPTEEVTDNMPTDSTAADPDETLADDEFLADLAALREAPTRLIDVEETLLTIPIRKPKTDEFFRTHPDYMQDVPLLQVELNERKEQFFVAAKYRPAVLDRLAYFRLVACVNRAGTAFLWPVSLSDASVARRWRDTALLIVEAGFTAWVSKAVADGGYKLVTAKGDLGEPTWPAMSFPEMVRLAFTADSHTITGPDHYAIRHINGEA